VAGASFSWACTAEAAIQLFPKSGPVGTEVTVIGDAFVEDEPVEIRLDSPTGPLLGTAMGAHFETVVTLPEMEPGQHTIIGLHVDTGVQTRPSAGVAPQQFLTTPGRAPEPKPDGNGKPEQNKNNQPNNQGTQGGEGSQSDQGTQGNQGSSAQSTSTEEITPTDTDRELDRTATDSGRTVFAGSLPLDNPVPAASGKDFLGPTASGLFAEPVTEGAPSLITGAQTYGDDPLKTPFAVGIALLGFGSLALVAGAFMFLLLGKREAQAAAEQEQQNS
jgi:hypothetical protein